MKRPQLLIAVICLLLICAAWFPYLMLRQRIDVAERECLPGSSEVQCVLLPKMKTAENSTIKWSSAESAFVLTMGVLLLALARKRASA